MNYKDPLYKQNEQQDSVNKHGIKRYISVSIISKMYLK